MLTVGYVRVSTQRQVNEGVSISQQTEEINKYGIMVGLISPGENLKVYIDDGYSASDLNRPNMQMLLKDVKANKIEFIITYDFDRISRDIVDANLFLRLLKTHKINLKCLRGDVDIATANDRFGTNVKFAAKQLERETVVEKTNAALFHIASSERRYPNGGKVPFGYTRGEDKNIYVDAYTSGFIKEIFLLAIQGKNLLDISKIIGEKTKIKKFESTVILKILNDERYAGTFRYKGEVYYDIIPPIITAKQQEEALQNYKRSSKANNIYLFNGVAYCSKCKGKLASTHGTSGTNNKKYFYYKCDKCKGNISQQYLINEVLAINVSNIKRESEIKRLRREIPTLKQRIQRLKEKYILKHFSDQEYCMLVIPLVDELSDMEVRLKVLNLYIYDSADFLAITEKEKYEYIHSNFKKVWINTQAKRVNKIEYFER